MLLAGKLAERSDSEPKQAFQLHSINDVTWRWGHKTSLDDGVEVDNNSSSLIRYFNLGTSGNSSL